MKQFIIIILVAVATFIVPTSTAKAGWFDNHEQEQQEQISQLQSQIQQQEKSKGSWQGAAFLLGITSVITLLIGAAMGSKGRKAAQLHE